MNIFHQFIYWFRVIQFKILAGYFFFSIEARFINITLSENFCGVQCIHSGMQLLYLCGFKTCPSSQKEIPFRLLSCSELIPRPQPLGTTSRCSVSLDFLLLNTRLRGKIILDSYISISLAKNNSR